LRFSAAAISRATSSRLKITGSVRGTCTAFIFAINAGLLSVTSKKNRSPVIVAFKLTGEVPSLTRWS
jgi:hypothetical protein